MKHQGSDCRCNSVTVLIQNAIKQTQVEKFPTIYSTFNIYIHYEPSRCGHVICVDYTMNVCYFNTQSEKLFNITGLQ